MIGTKTPEYIAFLRSKISGMKPEIEEMMIEYALTPEEHQIALEKTRQYCFAGKHPVAEPKIFVVVAQTGGGKSSLTARILKDNPNTVVIDSDAFKAFNPLKDEIVQKYPSLYGYLTRVDAYMHRDEVYEEAKNKGYNILIETAPSTKDPLFCVHPKELHERGYIIEEDILAVSEINSLISVHERFEGQIESKMDSPKLTELKRARDSYSSVEIVLNEAINTDYINVNLWKRGKASPEAGEVFMPSPEFITSDKSIMLQEFKKAREEDQKKTLLTAEKRIKAVKKQMEQRNAPTEQRAQLSQIEGIVHSVEQRYE